MDIQSYYRTKENESNTEISNQYLVVNCTGVLSIKKPFSTQVARQRRDYYLMYMHKGTLEVKLKSRTFILNEGETIIFPSNTPYYYQKTNHLDTVYYWAHFTGYGVNEIIKNMKLSCSAPLLVGKDEEIVENFNRLFQCFLIHQNYCDEEASVILMEIFIKLARRTNNASEHNTKLTKLQKSIRYIYNNYRNDIKLNELAEIEFLSVSRYSALFKEVMGISPKNFITTMRINNARELLHHTNLTVRQISLTVGFNDSLYFSNLFKKKTGYAPLVYRNMKIHN